MESILTTKLHIPAAHPNRVSRPHLIDKLDENLWQVQGERFLRRLTLVAAPAGYGKSTLLYDWVDHLRIPVAWIGFDENDNEPERFFQYLIASLQKIQPGLGETYQSVLQSPQSWYISEIATNIMASLLNELAAISQPFLLVFDDYHTMQNQAIHQAVKLLLDHLPENLSVVIATRADPPIALSRLRARRQMVEVRANDLRFSESEAGPFLRQVMQVDLRDQEILSLTKSTEGWIAGLQMAALALQGRVDPIAFIHDFNGRQRFILDYLFEEVFSQQPEVVQTFLIQTSILERMNASLCEVLMGNSTGGESFHPISSVSASMSGQQFLEYLERFNLFIIPLDHQREWFRYHHLFTDLLRHHLRNTRSVEYIAGLYEQASRWCENQGFNDEAMHYAALSGSQEQLAKLVEISGNTLVQSGQTAQRPRLIRLLSVETLRSNPGLCVECAWSEILARQSPDLRQAEVYLQMAEQGVAENSDCVSSTGYPVAYRVVHTRAILSRFKGDAPETVIALTKKALELLPNDDYAYRCSLYQNLGMAYLAVANLEEALKNLQQSWEEARASGMSYVAIAATYMLCRCLQTQGRLDEMENLLRTALADFEQSESESRRIIPALGILYIVQAWLLLEQAGSREKMDTAAVEQAVKKGLERCALTAEQYAFAEGLALKARLLAAQGDLLGAYNCLEEMEAEIPGTASYCAAIRIRLMLAQNDNDARIELFAGRLPSKLDDWVYPVAVPPIVWHWEEQMGLVRLMIGRKRQSTAADLVPVLSYLDRKIEACTSAGWQMQRIELHLLKALALDADQNTSSAAEELAQAQVAAETHGFYRLLVEEGEPFADLLHRVHNRLPSTPLLHRLIVSLGLDDKLALHANPVNHPAKERSRAGLVDPLTEREFEVLKLIAGGFSNKEIAEKLVVTIGTVKAHTSNIYRKLDVPGRTKALAKAREIHLI